MAKRCPPGVICIENITIIFLIIVFCLAGFVWYKFGSASNETKQNHHYINISNPSVPKFSSIFFLSISFLDKSVPKLYPEDFES